MGGGGRIFDSGRRSPAAVAEKLKQMTQEAAGEFESRLAAELVGLLAKFNTRNTEEVRQRLDQIIQILGRKLDGSFQTLFGGSVAKHTYVDGISDVDALLVVSGSSADASPQSVLRDVAATLEASLKGAATVTTGSVAITVAYQDGTEIQLVPTVHRGGKLSVPAWEADTWSTIDPEQFMDGLTKRNAECAGKLIPTIKLAKAINSMLPEGAQLSGYHFESIAVAAFRGYKGPLTTVQMLPFLFRKASELVLSPMRDRTGQSVHVDESLGPDGGAQRQAISHVLHRVCQRMENASAAHSVDRWLDLFEE